MSFVYAGRGLALPRTAKFQDSPRGKFLRNRLGLVFRDFDD